jgi:hypothetical protein
MSARDDFGSRAGTPGGYGGGAGGLGNGGVAGGRNGGSNSSTGLTTGTTWRGNTYVGRPGGMGSSLADMFSAPRAQGVRQASAPPTIVPVGAPPPVAPLPTSAWLKAYGNINSPIATGYAYSPGDMTGARPMQDYPRYQSQPQRLAPGQPKYQDRLPGNVGPGDWRGQASNPRAISGQNWGNPGSGSMGLGSAGGGRGGGGGGGF